MSSAPTTTSAHATSAPSVSVTPLTRGGIDRDDSRGIALTATPSSNSETPGSTRDSGETEFEWEKELLSMANFGEEGTRATHSASDIRESASVGEIFDAVRAIDSTLGDLFSKEKLDANLTPTPIQVKVDETKRMAVTEEIISVERRYIAVLREGLTQLLKVLLSEETKGISSATNEGVRNDKKQVLKDIEKIAAVHEEFINDISQHVSDAMIGEYLLNKTESWPALYSLYVTRSFVLTMDVNTDPRLTDGPVQENFFQEPITHLYKFCDLISLLLHRTPKEHPDYMPTSTLLMRSLIIADRTTTTRVAHFIGKYSGPALTHAIAESSSPTLTSGAVPEVAQTLFRYGPVQVNNKNQHMFLFDHTLIITTPKTKKSFLSSTKGPQQPSLSISVTKSRITLSGTGIGAGVFPSPPLLAPKRSSKSSATTTSSSEESKPGDDLVSSTMFSTHLPPTPASLAAGFSSGSGVTFQFVRAVELFRCALDVGSGASTCSFTLVCPAGRLVVATSTPSDRDAWICDLRKLIASAIEDELHESEKKQDKTLLQRKREEYAQIELQRKAVMKKIAQAETEYLVALHELHDGLRIVTEKLLLSDSITVLQNQLKPLEQLYTDATRILQLHEDIHTLLTRRESEWEIKTTLCDIFTEYLPIFQEHYMTYVTKFSEKMHILSELISSCPGVSPEKLKQQLLQPVHRLAQYRTDCQEMVSITPPTHYDHGRLSDVTLKLQQLSTTIILTASTYSKPTATTTATPSQSPTPASTSATPTEPPSSSSPPTTTTTTTTAPGSPAPPTHYARTTLSAAVARKFTLLSPAPPTTLTITPTLHPSTKAKATTTISSHQRVLASRANHGLA
ncbi:hypothetical protein Pelo_4120 [Pelomyxa schiedti]|nr:hypothetical protein Pelo_4120 [Pelomyxa schiedti]